MLWFLALVNVMWILPMIGFTALYVHESDGDRINYTRTIYGTYGFIAYILSIFLYIANTIAAFSGASSGSATPALFCDVLMAVFTSLITTGIALDTIVTRRKKVRIGEEKKQAKDPVTEAEMERYAEIFRSGRWG